MSVQITSPIRSDYAAGGITSSAMPIATHSSNTTVLADDGVYYAVPKYDYISSANGIIHVTVPAAWLHGFDIVNMGTLSSWGFPPQTLPYSSQTDPLIEGQVLSGVISAVLGNKPIKYYAATLPGENTTKHCNLSGSLTIGTSRWKHSYTKSVLANWPNTPYDVWLLMKPLTRATLNYSKPLGGWFMTPTAFGTARNSSDLNSYMSYYVNRSHTLTSGGTPYIYECTVRDLKVERGDRHFSVSYEFTEKMLYTVSGARHAKVWRITRSIQVDEPTTVSPPSPVDNGITKSLYTVNTFEWKNLSYKTYSISGGWVSQPKLPSFTKTIKGDQPLYLTEIVGATGGLPGKIASIQDFEGTAFGDSLYIPTEKGLRLSSTDFASAMEQVVNYHPYRENVNRGVGLAAIRALDKAVNAVNTDLVETLVEYESAVELLFNAPGWSIESMISRQSKANVQKIIAEAGDLLGPTPAKQFARAFTMQGLRNTLEPSTRRQWNHLVQNSEWLRKNVAEASSRYLQFAFGWLPIVTLASDAPAIAEALSYIGKGQKGQAHGVYKFEGPIDTGTPDLTSNKFAATCHITYSIGPESVASLIVPLARAGIFQPFKSLWNILPFSWLVDVFDKRIANVASSWDYNLMRPFIGVDHVAYTATSYYEASPAWLARNGFTDSSQLLVQYFEREISQLLLAADGQAPFGDSRSSSANSFIAVGAFFGTTLK